MYHLFIYLRLRIQNRPASECRVLEDTVQFQMVCGSLATRKFITITTEVQYRPCASVVSISRTHLARKLGTSFLGARSPSTQHVLHY